jgi:hypothetical protein
MKKILQEIFKINLTRIIKRLIVLTINKEKNLRIQLAFFIDYKQRNITTTANCHVRKKKIYSILKKQCLEKY